MLTEDEALAGITDVVRDVLDNETVQLRGHMKPADVEGWDSLANVSIIVGVERTYKIRFTTQQVEGLETVGDLVRLTIAALAAKG